MRPTIIPMKNLQGNKYKYQGIGNSVTGNLKVISELKFGLLVNVAARFALT